MKNLRIFKTIHGENIIAELFAAADSGVLYLRRPIKVIQQLQATQVGIMPIYIPMLYFPFGSQQVYPFSTEMFCSIIPPSDFDVRWYQKSLQALYLQETKRMLTESAMFDEYEYPDKLIMAAPTTIQ